MKPSLLQMLSKDHSAYNSIYSVVANAKAHLAGRSLPRLSEEDLLPTYKRSWIVVQEPSDHQHDEQATLSHSYGVPTHHSLGNLSQPVYRYIDIILCLSK
jgi:hypothetical protein